MESRRGGSGSDEGHEYQQTVVFIRYALNGAENFEMVLGPIC